LLLGFASEAEAEVLSSTSPTAIGAWKSFGWGLEDGLLAAVRSDSYAQDAAGSVASEEHDTLIERLCRLPAEADLGPPDAAGKVGRLGPYRLVRTLASGGMGWSTWVGMIA
jgi:hypothetical protein